MNSSRKKKNKLFYLESRLHETFITQFFIFSDFI